jgi:hypothetical protein
MTTPRAGVAITGDNFEKRSRLDKLISPDIQGKSGQHPLYRSVASELPRHYRRGPVAYDLPNIVYPTSCPIRCQESFSLLRGQDLRWSKHARGKLRLPHKRQEDLSRMERNQISSCWLYPLRPTRVDVCRGLSLVSAGRVAGQATRIQPACPFVPRQAPGRRSVPLRLGTLLGTPLSTPVES